MSTPTPTSVRPPVDITGKILTKRVRAKNRSTLILSYTASDAQALRDFAKTIHLRGDRIPPLSLLARRALQVYLPFLARAETKAAEIAALEKMVTREPSNKKRRERP